MEVGMKNKYLIYMAAFLIFGIADLFYLNSKVIPSLWSEKKLTAESTSTKENVAETDNLAAREANPPVIAPEKDNDSANIKSEAKESYSSESLQQIDKSYEKDKRKNENKSAQPELAMKMVVRFKMGEHKLGLNYRKMLLLKLKQVAPDKNVFVKIDGHTDRRTTANFDNQRLSQQRADYVADLLIEQGILEDHITAIGHGDSQPLDSKDTPEAYAKNRRAEIKFFEDKP
jgi:outer membrane protein OmpA-like peptidoglycan-associated protein